ncbi:MAG: cysteine--tRNA ligase [bacterium]|nr:cysteine--tRNA ligase [bacterium]
MLRLFNTLTHKIEKFKPIKAGLVKLYVCGPTVYNYATIGNLRAYIFADLLRRFFEYRNLKIKYVMNITDVDDKTIRESQNQKKTLKAFTDFYLRGFIGDLKSLNIKLPDVMPKATEHVREMINLIKILLKKGFAYKAEDGSVYFKISKFPQYGELAQIEKQDLKPNIENRLNAQDEYNKENINDFVLWKAWKPSDGKVFWQTDLGKGRPGWHIECSAMSMKYLSPHFDIHGGGIDLIFPHHTNEIAQSEAATGKKFVNYWLHNAHLIVEGQKMSKSLGNFYTLQDIEAKKINPLLLRLILLKTHYRQTLDFSFKNFDEAKAIASKFLNFLIELDFVKNKEKNNLKIKPLITDCRTKFEEAFDDDLNISAALAELFNFMNGINNLMGNLNAGQTKEIKKFIFEIDSVLGFIEPSYKEYQAKKTELLKNKNIQSLLEKRDKLRKEKKYSEADKIRNQLMGKGIVVNDAPQGNQIRLNQLF